MHITWDAPINQPQRGYQLRVAQLAIEATLNSSTTSFDIAMVDIGRYMVELYHLSNHFGSMVKMFPFIFKGETSSLKHEVHVKLLRQSRVTWNCAPSFVQYTYILLMAQN